MNQFQRANRSFHRNPILVMKKFLRVIALLSLGAIGSQSHAAMVGPAGYSNDFGTQPSAADWATVSRTGAAGDTYDMDTDVNANITASGTTAQTSLNANNPATQLATATWSSSGFYLQTRPTGNRYTALMGKFVNQTGTNATQINLSYLFTIAAGPTPEESGRGTRVYVSLTGLAGSWMNLATLNSIATNNGSSTMTTNLALNWTNGGSLYVLWTDDNSTAPAGVTDPANQIDTFALYVTAGLPPTLTCTVSSPASNALFVAGTPITTAASVIYGTAPYTVEYFTNSGVGNTVFASAGVSSTAPYNLPLGSLSAGTYNIYAVATDGGGPPALAASRTNRFNVADPLLVALTAPAHDSSFSDATPVMGTATVSGGTPPYSVQFYLDDVVNGAPVVAEPFQRNFGLLFVGDHTIKARVTDAAGWSSNSLVSVVHITGPLGVNFQPTNGASLTYGQSVVLTASPGGGAAPYFATFYVNDQEVGDAGSPPFMVDLGLLPAGAYTCYVHVADSSAPVPQEVMSAASVVTVLPNPLLVSLTSPTNGQSATAGQPFAIAATASVTTPLTVSSVELFYDGVSLGLDAVPPYSISVASPATGAHLVYARATDSLGRAAYSATNTVTFVVDPLANNNFANRFAISTPAHVSGNNTGATTESGEPTSVFGGGTFLQWGATLWYKWTPPTSGTVTIDTFGSSFNTVLSVYTGSAVNGLTLVQRNDDASGNTASRVSFAATVGTEYQIQVAGYRPFGGGSVAQTGAFQLNLTMPPVVSITSPANGASFTVGSNIAVAVTASSSAGLITQLGLYSGTNLLGSSTNSSQTFIVSNAPPGTNSYYAVATDSIGQVSTSAVVNVGVFNIGLTLVSPATGTSYPPTNLVTVSAFALLESGTMTNVEFLADGVKFAEDSSAPFSVSWDSATAGSHRLTAVGRDSAGNSHVSQTVFISIGQVLFPVGSHWRYLDNGSDQGTAWRAPDFNDSTWLSGDAELGYGDGDEATEIASGPTDNFYITTYFRRSFVVSNAAGYVSLLLSVKRDDGAVVYLNGVEAARFNMASGSIDYLTTPSNANDDGTNFWPATVPSSLLVEGTNVVAVELHQSSATSTDVSFDMALSAIPAIVYNNSPTAALVSPTNGQYFLAPPAITLLASASDSDGTVTKVEFFADGVKLGEDTTAPFSFEWSAPPAGVYDLTVVATDNLDATQESTPVTISIYEAASHWVAFNDHVAGPETHPNATAWNAFGTVGGGAGDEGALRSIATGATLPAYLTIMELQAQPDTLSGALPVGTPAYDIFHGYVDFGSGGASHAILMDEHGLAMHLFTGLDPLRRYRLRLTAVGAAPGTSNHWTLCTLAGVDDFIPVHTPGVLTSAGEPSLAEGEAAFNSGDNQSGQVVGWDNIAPSADGAFFVFSEQYLGPAPGNEIPGAAAYAPTAIRLEEVSDVPWAQITAPLNGYTVQGPTNIVLTAFASSVSAVTNVLYLANGVPLTALTTAPYTFDWTNVPFGTHVLRAVAFNAAGVVGTSAPVSLTITIPPTNTIPPEVFTQVPEFDSTITNLATIQVFFSERVVGVDAADLLVNGVPATGVTGSDSNYTFTVVQPSYGPVTVTWAVNHGITDVGWPSALPFDGEAFTWQYTLVDRTPPWLTAKTPAAGSALTNLIQISVTFSEVVSGVNASDFLINGVPADDVIGSASNYTFLFAQPASGTVNITWAGGHGITDLSSARNPFNATGAGSTWSYTLDSKSILIQSNSYWFFVKGTNEASIPTNLWREIGFDHSGWSNAPAPFFYGDPYSNGLPAFTLLSDMRSNYSTIYLRKSFVVPNAGHVTNLFLRAQIDDGMIVWINGVEVLRTNVAAGEIPYNGTALSASSDQNGAPYVTYSLLDPRNYLLSGTNVIAVHGFNESLGSSSDFGFNAQLFTYQADTEAVAPRIVRRTPAAGYVLALTNITVTFSEAVAGVEAADLLINGLPATDLTSETNTTYTFRFPQPPYGHVSITWAESHGIMDLDISPKPFDALAAASVWQYVLLNPNSPYVVSSSPAPNASLTALSAITVVFSEPLTGVDAGDLLINNIPATGISGSGDTYTFSFLQPAYGVVAITWATNHAIQDMAEPPNAFDPEWPGNTWTYTLVDMIPPAVASQTPPASTWVTNLTQLTVNFTEPVTGVNASDLLINGTAASSVTGTNATYTFSFSQPNATVINVTWAVSHGIRDKATSPNAFDALAPGATWSYFTPDNVPPSLANIIPAPSATVAALQQITVAFNEPVQGVGVGSLTLNGSPALGVSGAGAGPYVFTFSQPSTGTVLVALSAGISDLAALPNPYPGSNWTYVLNPNLPPPSFDRGPYLQVQTPTSIVIRWRTTTATDSRVEFGLDAASRTNIVDDAAQTTQHIVTLTNLMPDTQYVYACGTTDGRMMRSTNLYFRTAPPVGTVRPTRIWYISDFGFGNADERAVRDSYVRHIAPEKRADVWITGGDVDQISGTDANYTADVFSTNTAYGFMMQSHTLWPTPGNHDYITSQGANYYAAFSMPTVGEGGGVPSGTEQYYSFDHNNIHFISLNGIEGTFSASTNTAMVQWLHHDLMANTQKWVIAYWHGPPYTKGSHDSDSTTDTLAWMVQMRQNIVPILESYGVDLVLCGHSHVHERTWLIQGHYGFSSTFSETNKVDGGDGKLDGSGAYRQKTGGIGTVYVSNGMGGQPRNTSNEQHPAHLVKITGVLGSLVIDVDGGQLDCKFVNTNGTVLDYFTLIKSSDGSPQLLIAGGNGLTTVSWPKSATDYDLWHRGALAPVGAWQLVTNGVQTNATDRFIRFGSSTNGPAGFFRLQRR